MTTKEFDNIVSLEIKAPWPLPAVSLRATLSHTFECFGRVLSSLPFPLYGFDLSSHSFFQERLEPASYLKKHQSREKRCSALYLS